MNAKQQLRIRLEQETRRIAEMISPHLRAGVGFALTLFDFGGDGSIAYASNGDRDDVMRALRELLANIGRGEGPEGVVGKLADVERQLAQARAALDAQTEKLATALRGRAEAEDVGIAALAIVEGERDEARTIARRLRCCNDGQGDTADLKPLIVTIDGWPDNDANEDYDARGWR